MKRFVSLAAVVFLAVGVLVAEPVVDGKVSAGEYSNSKSVLSGAGTLSWAGDGSGGLYIALSVKAEGWAGVGLGAKRMNGAYIYMGFLGSDGKAVFSEQAGRGHTHRDSGKKTADKFSVTQSGGLTVLEFHVPTANLPFTGNTVNFITAYSNSADLVTQHDDYDTGSFAKP